MISIFADISIYLVIHDLELFPPTFGSVMECNA